MKYNANFCITSLIIDMAYNFCMESVTGVLFTGINLLTLSLGNMMH